MIAFVLFSLAIAFMFLTAPVSPWEKAQQYWSQPGLDLTCVFHAVGTGLLLSAWLWATIRFAIGG